VISVLRPVPTPPDPADRSPERYRAGLTSARRELRAASARRHRAELDASSTGPAEPPATAMRPADDLTTQRAGVRAALAELRRHGRAAEVAVAVEGVASP